MTPTGYKSNELADDLAALLEHLGIAHARVIGHSFGGSVALHFALSHGDRCAGAVICDTGFAALRYLRVIDEWPGWEMWKEELPKYGITKDWFAQADQEGVDVVLRKSLDIPVQFGLRTGGSRNTPRFRKLLDETSVGQDFRDPAGLTEDRLATIAPPVLALYGETSPFRGVANHLSSRVCNCAASVIPGVGHFFLLHAPEMFIESVQPFLRDPAGFVQHRKAGDVVENASASLKTGESM
jgi:pimeloyl-ACP methyl ester carboxylesterase